MVTIIDVKRHFETENRKYDNVNQQNSHVQHVIYCEFNR